MIIIGLTGGIASGKSTVSRMLQEKGAVVLDADQIARDVVLPGKPAWREIVDTFGRSVLKKDGTLDRSRLGELVFSNSALRLKLNKIVHPRVGQELLSRTKAVGAQNSAAVLVYDVPLLIEAGMHQMVDLVLLIFVTPEIQLKRLQERDKFSREEALARLVAQMPIEEKQQFADHVIDNNGALQETARQVEKFWEKITGGDGLRR